MPESKVPGALKRKKGGGDDDDSGMPKTDGWMMTYGDMTTLLLTFFVLMVASATFTEEKLIMVFGALSKAFGIQPNYTSVIKPQFKPIVLKQRMGGNEKAKKAAKQIQEQLQREMQMRQGNQAKVEVEARGNEVLIKVPNQAFFDLGKADLRPEAKPFLDGVIKVIKQWPNRVKIDGHTDDLPINTPEFPSNWELSGARALTVLKYLLKNGNLDPSRLSWTGYGEYHPVERLPGESIDHWRARCRRIEIAIRFDSPEDIPPDRLREGVNDLSRLLQPETMVVGQKKP